MNVSLRLMVVGALLIGALAVVVLIALPKGDEIVCDLGRDNESNIIGHDVGVSTVRAKACSSSSAIPG